MNDHILIYFFFLPFFAAFSIPVLNLISKKIKQVYVPAIMLLLTVLSGYILFGNSDTMNYALGGWEPVDNIAVGIHLVGDGFSRFMLLIVNGMAFLCLLYAVSYIRPYTGQKYFYILFCLKVAGLNGVVLSGDLFNLFVFMEVSSKASYALVAFGVKKTELEASFKYQVLGGLATMFVLLGIALIYWMTSTLNMAEIAVLLRENELHDGKLLLFVQLFFIAGLGIKAALIPFHAWLPDAHASAPSPVSAMLSAVVIKVLGIYVIMRLFINVFPPDHTVSLIFTAIGAISMLAGVILAIGSWDLKRMLAYSSISQMGYVMMGVGIGMGVLSSGKAVEAAILTFAGALFHMLNHAISKGLLFLNAGAIEHATGNLDLKRMGGLARMMPVTMTTSFVASIAIAGIPPTGGFFSRFAIIEAAVAGGYHFRSILGILVGILTLSVFIKFQSYAFWGKSQSSGTIQKPGSTMIISMVILAFLCLALGVIALPGIREVIIMPAVEVFINPTGYSNP